MACFQILATNEFPSSPTTTFLKVYKVKATAPTNSFAELVYGPLNVPAGDYGCPGGSNSAGAFAQYAEPTESRAHAPVYHSPVQS